MACSLEVCMHGLAIRIGNIQVPSTAVCCVVLCCVACTCHVHAVHVQNVHECACVTVCHCVSLSVSVSVCVIVCMTACDCVTVTMSACDQLSDSTVSRAPCPLTVTADCIRPQMQSGTGDGGTTHTHFLEGAAQNCPLCLMLRAGLLPCPGRGNICFSCDCSHDESGGRRAWCTGVS